MINGHVCEIITWVMDVGAGGDFHLAMLVAYNDACLCCHLPYLQKMLSHSFSFKCLVENQRVGDQPFAYNSHTLYVCQG